MVLIRAHGFHSIFHWAGLQQVVLTPDNVLSVLSVSTITTKPQSSIKRGFANKLHTAAVTYYQLIKLLGMYVIFIHCICVLAGQCFDMTSLSCYETTILDSGYRYIMICRKCCLFLVLKVVLQADVISSHLFIQLKNCSEYVNTELQATKPKDWAERG